MSTEQIPEIAQGEEKGSWTNCRLCKRRLTREKYKARGYGPVCAKKFEFTAKLSKSMDEIAGQEVPLPMVIKSSSRPILARVLAFWGWRKK